MGHVKIFEIVACGFFFQQKQGVNEVSKDGGSSFDPPISIPPRSGKGRQIPRRMSQRDDDGVHGWLDDVSANTSPVEIAYFESI